MKKAECGFMILCGTNGRTQTPRMAARDQIPDSAMHLLRASTPSHVKRSQTLQSCLKHRLITGVATSVCQTNIDDLLNREWVQRLIDLGVHYVWYHTYRPVGADAHPDCGRHAAAGAQGR